MSASIVVPGPSRPTVGIPSPGPPGVMGHAGPSTVQRVAATAIPFGTVCRTTGDQTMTPALTRLTDLPFHSLCLGDIGSGATGNFHVVGPVPREVIHLSAGVACAVGVNASGMPVRATDPTCVSAPNWLGFCDTSGTITVQPILKLTFDVLDFGCFCNGVDDDYPGLRSLFDHLPAFPNLRGAEIRLPRGDMWLSQDFHVDRLVQIRGAGAVAGGDQNNGTVIHFAPGSGFIIDDYQTGTAHNFGSGSTLERFAIRSRMLIPANSVYYGLYTDTMRAPSRTYALNDVVIPYNTTPTRSNTKRCFRATTAGTTASTPPFGTDPAGFSLTTTGDTVVDGTVVWTCEQLPDDYIVNGHHYNVGDRVFTVGDTRLAWECVLAGDTAGGPNNPLDGIAQPLGGDVVDGGVTWRPKPWAGIMCFTGNMQFKHLLIQGFTGYAIFVEGDGAIQPLNIADFGRIDDVHYFGCGGGVAFKGFDAQGWLVLNCEGTLFGAANGARTVKDGTVGSGVNGFYDASLGNTYINCYYQGDGGPGFYVPVNTGSTFIGCHSESSYRSVIATANVYVGSGSTAGVGGSGGIINGQETSGIHSVDRTGAKVLTAGTDLGDGFSSLWMSSEDEAGGQTIGFRYQSANGDNPGTGWWGLCFGLQNPRTTIGVSGAAAPEGAGLWADYHGHFVGTGANQHWHGVGLDSLVDKRVRGGQYKVGDRWDVVSDGQVGSYTTVICKTAGFRGSIWVPNGGYTAGYAPWHLQADMVEPIAHDRTFPTVGGRVFRCTIGGLSGGVEPDWSTAPNTNDTIVDNQVTWTNVGTVAQYNCIGLISALP